MFKNLATIVEVFGDRVLSLVGLRPMCNHRTMVVGGRRHILVPRIVHWSPNSSTTIVRWSESGRRLLKECPKLPAVVGDQRRLVSEQSPSSLRPIPWVIHTCMVVRWSCNNRRLAYDLDSKMLRSLKTCRKAIVVCDCSYDCGKNHCDCPRSLPVVGSRRS